MKKMKATHVQFIRDAKRLLTHYLEENNLRKTPERYAILEEAYRMAGHFDVELLYEHMKKSQQRVSRATLYNCLELLSNCKLIMKHQFTSQITHYEASYGYRQHHHLICSDCRKIIEFCDPRVYYIEQAASKELDFEVFHTALLLYGRCKRVNCKNKSEVA